MNKITTLLILSALVAVPAGLSGQELPVLSPEVSQKVRALVEKLQDPNAEVRKKAAESLKALGPMARDATRPLLKAKYEERNSDNWVRYECGEAILAIGKPAVPALIAALGDQKNPERYDAAQMLWHMSNKHGGRAIKSAIPALIEALGAGPPTSQFAVHALGSLGSEGKEAVPALEKALAFNLRPVDKQQIASVLVTVSGGRSEPAKKYLKQFERNQQLIEAAQKGDSAQVRQQLADGAEVNARYVDQRAFLSSGMSDYTALMCASLAGHERVVELLIEAKADLNLSRKEKTSLYMAVMADKEAVVDLLVKAGAKGDPKQIRLSHELFRAACRGYKLRDGEGYPPYPGAIRQLNTAPPADILREVKPGNVIPPRPEDPENARRILKVLKRGADVNAADPEGHTALMYAANLGLVENVKVLLANGADATLKTKYGATALSLTEGKSSVARAERRKVAELLKVHLAKKK